MAQTTDERLYALMGDRPAFQLALAREVRADHAHLGPFLGRAADRFGERQSVCLWHLAEGLRALRLDPGDPPGATEQFAAAAIEATLPRLGDLGPQWATGMMALGYALALADLAAVPPEDERH